MGVPTFLNKLFLTGVTPEAGSICALQDLLKNVSTRIVKIVHSAAAKLAVLSIYSSSGRGQYFRAFLVVFQIFFFYWHSQFVLFVHKKCKAA